MFGFINFCAALDCTYFIVEANYAAAMALQQGLTSACSLPFQSQP
jgi:hypothetical protein